MITSLPRVLTMAGQSLRYRYSALNTETAKFLTYIIIVSNIIFTVLGAMMFAMGLYALFETDFRRWVNELGMQHYWTGVYILLAAGVLTMIQVFFGVLGAYQKKRTYLHVFCVSVSICIILEIVGASYMLSNGIRFSKVEIWLRETFLQLIAEFDYDESSRRMMNIIQEWVGCCGADGILDYIQWNKVIPTTCYNPVNGNAWYRAGYGYVGCVRGFTWYLEPMTGWISGLALSLAFLQVFALIAAVMLSCVKQDFRSKSNLHLDR